MSRCKALFPILKCVYDCISKIVTVFCGSCLMIASWEAWNSELQINVWISSTPEIYLSFFLLYFSWYLLYTLDVKNVRNNQYLHLYTHVQLTYRINCLYVSVTNTKAYFGHWTHFNLAVYCYISFLFLINVIYNFCK